jgi:ribonuclease D
VIDTDQKLAALLPALRSADWIALDTEADSLHAYPEKLCLLQLSLASGEYLIDPLAQLNLTPLLEVLQQRELILHGADYDLRMLRKGFGFVPAAVFDTMIASRLLGCREFGLNNLVSTHLGVHLEKGPQKANWARRPLTPRMENYARNDTHYLKPLSDLLRAQLVEKGRLPWLQETCDRLIADCTQPRPPDPDLVWRVKGSHQLGPPALAVLREIWRWREAEAVAANKPPFFILPPETMVHLAINSATGAPPEHLPHHLSPRRRHGILHAIEQGRAASDLPAVLRSRGRRQSEAEKKRYLELHRRRDRHAHDLGLDSTLIASRAMLVLLARDWKAYEGELMQWQRRLLQA